MSYFAIKNYEYIKILYFNVNFIFILIHIYSYSKILFFINIFKNGIVNTSIHNYLQPVKINKSDKNKINSFILTYSAY